MGLRFGRGTQGPQDPLLGVQDEGGSPWLQAGFFTMTAVGLVEGLGFWGRGRTVEQLGCSAVWDSIIPLNPKRLSSPG